jgi:hypothetical protein
VTRDELLDALRDENPLALLLDGFEDAIVGVGRRVGRPALAVYDYARIVQILMDREGLTYEEAVEHADFNVTGGWFGVNTPVILYPFAPEG